MKPETEKLPLIQKLKKQKHTIIHEISIRPTVNLLEIQAWIKEINFDSPSVIIAQAFIIDTIFFYIENKFKTKKEDFVETVLIYLIRNWSNLQDQEIGDIDYNLKEYANTDDVNFYTKLKKIIDKSGASLPKQKKKLIPRIIKFDEEGVGYEFFNWDRCYLDNINLEIEFPEKIKRKLLQQELLKEELERLGKMEIIQGRYLNRIERKIKIMEFEFFASKEQKEARQRNIEQKIENDKKCKDRQKIYNLITPKILSIQEKIEIYKKVFDSKSLNIEFSLSETSNDDFLIAFLKTIDYEKFKELINFSDDILNSIDNIRETFKKIDDFSESLGIASNYIGTLDSYYRQIKENFNRERIANFLENALILFKQRTLLLTNNYSLLEMQAKKNAIVFLEPNFLNEFISSYNSRKVYKILYSEISQFLAISMPIKIIKSKYKLFYFIFNEYYCVDKKSKEKLIRKFFSNVSDLSSFETIKNIMFTLKWWQFFLIGISPICIFKKGFRARLSNELFLDSLEKIFKKIDTTPELNQKIDMLYDLRNLINSSTLKIDDDSINLNSLNIMNSRQAIVSRLENQIKKEGALFDNVQTLSDQVSSCINEFYNLNYVCRREIEKASEKNEVFQFNKDDVSKLHFPLKFTR